MGYGIQHPDYKVNVLNEREARAGAGILFAIGIITLLNSIFLGHFIVSRFFIAFFTFDFLIRVIKPEYSPSLLLGRFFVRNQKPEYVGAIQKRFAWGIGLVLAIPMSYYIVYLGSSGFNEVLVCIFCLFLLIGESAFSLCMGCMIFNLIFKEKAKLCPGGACELEFKEEVQKFNIVQKIIVLSTVALILLGTYKFYHYGDDKTYFTVNIKNVLMSDEERKKVEEEKFEKQSREFFEDDEDWE
jgi:hypothetical protein